MAEIHNLKDLNELGRDLKCQDIICFDIEGGDSFRYVVHIHYLNNDDGSQDNSVIFNYLTLDIKETLECVKKYYGYSAINVALYKRYPDIWPEYKIDDFKAVERLIREIYRLLGDESVSDPKERIISRFDILDIREK